jgi:excisionase family DNA binding protein
LINLIPIAFRILPDFSPDFPDLYRALRQFASSYLQLKTIEMQTNNPFDVIIERLEQLQSTVNDLAERKQTAGSKDSGTDPEKLLNLVEAAQIMRKPVGTVRYYIHSRNLPATKIGKSYLIKTSALLKWVDEFNQPKTIKQSLNPMLANRKRYAKSK